MADAALSNDVKEQITSHDASTLKTVPIADKSRVSAHDMLLATVGKGDPKGRLKNVETTEKAWKPTADDIAEDKKES